MQVMSAARHRPLRVQPGGRHHQDLPDLDHPRPAGRGACLGGKPFPRGERAGQFVVLASGRDSDADALRIRADARLAAATLAAGQSAEYPLGRVRKAIWWRPADASRSTVCWRRSVTAWLSPKKKWCASPPWKTAKWCWSTWHDLRKPTGGVAVRMRSSAVPKESPMLPRRRTCPQPCHRPRRRPADRRRARLERRDADDTHLAAGMRTFGLVGLLGGLAALLGSHLGVAAWIAIALLAWPCSHWPLTCSACAATATWA